MERWPRPTVNAVMDGPPPRFRYEAPQYPPLRPGPLPGETLPRVYYPHGGPWEGRPLYNAGLHGRAEQRAPHRDSQVDGQHEPPQHGATRPGMPHPGPVRQEVACLPPMHRAEELYGNFSSGGLQSHIIPADGSIPNIPQRRAPEPLQGVMPHNAPWDATQRSQTAGRLQPPHQAPELPQDMLPYNAPRDGTQGRPQHQYGASEAPHSVMPHNAPWDGTQGRPQYQYGAPEAPHSVMPQNAPRDDTQGRPQHQYGASEAPHSVMPHNAPWDGTQQLLTPGRPQQRAPELPQGVIPYNAQQDGNQAQTKRRPQTHNRAPEPPQGVIPYNTPRDGTPQSLIPARPYPQNRAPEPAQDVIPYNAPEDGTPQSQNWAPEPPQEVIPCNAPRDGTPQSLIPVRPPQVIPASVHDNVSGNRRESQDVTRRPTGHTDIYRSGERHDRRGGPEDKSAERQDPIYTESPLFRGERPDWFHQGGPSRFKDSDPTPSPYSSSHLSRGPPTGFHRDLRHNRSNLQLAYQNEGVQPGASRAGMYNVNTPPVPDTLHYRAPSPGIQQYSVQPSPTQDPPQQGRYHLPPIQGNPSNSSYAFHPPLGSVFGGSLEECDLEVPRLYSNHPPHIMNQQQSTLHQDRRQGPDPFMSSAMVAERRLERDAPFPHHGVIDGRRDPNLLLQHGVPFISQPTPHMEDMQTDVEKGGFADKDVFLLWLNGFLSRPRKKPLTKPEVGEAYSIAEARELMYGALRLVTQLDSLCQTLERRDKEGEPWTKVYEEAADIRLDLEGRLKKLERPGYIQGVKEKLDRVRKKRLRWQRRRQAEEEEHKAAAERSAEKEAAIDLWRMQCVQKVEEKKLERELKAAADHVLGEVRKKKNDVKKMLDVLKSLEKLRKLRKEAAGRKGVCPPSSADDTFTNHIKRLRTLVHKRSALYDAEEKTLRVILEGEQEEERQRETNKRHKKEKEKILQKQRELDDSLFGETEALPSLHPLQPFRQYYLQAEHSVVSLVQIRHEWDQFLVPPDHPDGSSIPRGWVVPAPPSSDTWVSAVKQLD